MPSASWALCSTTSIVVPRSRLSSANFSNRSFTISGARPSDGSSSSSTSGRDISARDTASICCSPPLRLPACWLRRSPSTGYASYHDSMSSLISLSLRAYAPAWRLSSTVSSGNVPRPCGTWAMPIRTMSAGSLPTSSWPLKRNEPRVSIIPDSARRVVVLPAPFAPRMTTTSPSFTSKSRPRSTSTGP